jgi:hypothetical protein
MSEGNFEAVKVSYRQTKDGMVVAFAIHPNDAPGDLATLKLGTRLMIGWAEIKDDETTAGADAPHPADTLGSDTSAPIKASPAIKRKFSELQPSQRAALLCNSPNFRQWVWEIDYGQIDRDSPASAADWLRARCGIKSRALLDTDPAAHATFTNIEEAYLHRNTPPAVPAEERYK